MTRSSNILRSKIIKSNNEVFEFGINSDSDKKFTY